MHEPVMQTAAQRHNSGNGRKERDGRSVEERRSYREEKQCRAACASCTVDRRSKKKINQKKISWTNMMRTRLVQTSKGEKRAGAGGASEQYV